MYIFGVHSLEMAIQAMGLNEAVEERQSWVPSNIRAGARKKEQNWGWGRVWPEGDQKESQV